MGDCKNSGGGAMTDNELRDEIKSAQWIAARLGLRQGRPDEAIETNTEKIIELIKDYALQSRIDELEATSYTDQSATSLGEITPGAGFNTIKNRIATLKSQLKAPTRTKGKNEQ